LVKKIENPMELAFKKAVLPDEIPQLLLFDQLIFGSYPDDLFSAEDWLEFDSYWVILDGRVVGCTAFKHHSDYDEEPMPGSLFIVTTGLIPEFQGKGVGTQVKKWQIEYASEHGFELIVTNMRESNAASKRLNQRFGFTVRHIDPGYYHDPEEAAIVMEINVANTKKLQNPLTE
jgi:ribosomal protein S18 acetylase RimI-like enzyme